MSVYAPLIGLFWRTLEANGIDPATLIEASVYHPDTPSLQERRISLQSFVQVQERVLGRLRQPDIGLQIAQLLHPSHLGPLGYAWLASSRLRTALLRAQRFYRMFNERAELRVEERPGEILVSYRLLSGHAFPAQLADIQYGGLVAMCRWNAGPAFRPARVQLARKSPADRRPWDRFFGLAVEFGSAANAVSIDASTADRVLTGSNPLLVSMHEDLIRRMLTKLHAPAIQREVQSAIVDQLPSGDVSEARIAAQLGISGRTLHRRLQQSGASFRPLLEEVRKGLADQYLRDPSYSVTDIAFLLGFADTSAFSRAFRRWHGLPPTAYRAAGMEGQEP